jgi:hypothetical protein
MWLIDGLYASSDGMSVKLLGIATNEVNDERIVYYTRNIQSGVPILFLPEDSFRKNYILFSRKLEEASIGSGFE